MKTQDFAPAPHQKNNSMELSVREELHDLRNQLIDRGCDTVLCHRLISEAEFGYGLIKDRLLSKSMKILEIGSGICALSYILAQRGHEVFAVEPVRSGYQNSRKILSAILEKANRLENFHFQDMKIQDFKGDQTFDLLFSVNVFEHLDDVDAALGVVSKSLAKDGAAIIAFPNYHFPYESHYGLPVFGTKKMTQAIFKNAIRRYDDENETHGLWETLNFLTSSEFKRLARGQSLRVAYERSIMERMFLRVSVDEEFLKRHRKMSRVLSFIVKSRIFKLFKFLPIRLHPYCYAELRRIEPGAA